MSGKDKLQKLAEQYNMDKAEIANEAQLWNFIVKALGEDHKPAEIKKYLLSVGWDAKKIDSTMQNIRQTMENLES